MTSQPNSSKNRKNVSQNFSPRTGRPRSGSCASIGSESLPDHAGGIRSRRRFSGSEAFDQRNWLRTPEVRLSREAYTYKPLPEGSWIRILTLRRGHKSDPVQCSLHEALLDDVSGKYDALSYVCRPKDVPMRDQTIYVDGCTLDVYANLFRFFIAARSEDTDSQLWVDAVCINQTNKSEKSHQVQHMGLIYKHACRTRIWLGQCDPGVDACLHWYHWLGEAVTSNTDSSRALPTFYDFPRFLMEGLLSNVCSNQYWMRLWIIQEAVLSLNLHFQIPGHVFPWDLLLQFDHVLRFVSEEQVEQGSEFRERVDTRMFLRLETRRMLNHATDLASLIKEYSWCECYDERDRVYGLLGLVEQDIVRVDYNASSIELFQHVMHSLPLNYLDQLAGPLAYSLRIPDALQSASADELYGLSVPVRLKPFGHTVHREGRLTWSTNPTSVLLTHSFSKESAGHGDELYSLINESRSQAGLSSSQFLVGPGNPRFLVILRRTSLDENDPNIKMRVPYNVVGTARVVNSNDNVDKCTTVFKSDMCEFARGALAWKVPSGPNSRQDIPVSGDEAIIEIRTSDFAKMRFAGWPNRDSSFSSAISIGRGALGEDLRPPPKVLAGGDSMD